MQTKKEKRQELKNIKSQIDDLNYYIRDFGIKMKPNVESARFVIIDFLDDVIEQTKNKI